MQFESRFETVTAASVVLDGVNLTVVSAGGRAHCVPADFFALFFQPSGVEVAKLEAVRVVKQVVKQLSPGLPKVEPALKKAAKPEAMGPSEALFSAIKESAMTTTDLTDRALLMSDRDPKNQEERRKMSASITYLKTTGRIEKRECPQTHLDKWFLVPKSKA